MKPDDLKYLACPACRGDLAIVGADMIENESIKTGVLRCLGCRQEYHIVRHIPRFAPAENYANSFGLEWSIHARTQYDSYTGTNISEKRFFEETGWSRQLVGETILEVGSGSGRFTEQAASTGAFVVSLDYSYAVDANYAGNGHKDNVFIIQGDLYQMPFKENFFDKLFCFGVLQHTPDPEAAFMALATYLKAGGSIVVDAYAIDWKILFKTFYLARPITKRIPNDILYKWVKAYVNLLWPLVRLIGRLPKGRLINRALLLIADYRGKAPLTDELLKEWAILDTFDSLSPWHDRPQSLAAVRRWFERAGLVDTEVKYGFNGIQGRGSKPRDCPAGPIKTCDTNVAAKK